MKIEKVGIVANMAKEDAPSVAAMLVERIEASGKVPLLLEDAAEAIARKGLAREPEELAGESDFVIALGGDGTLLHAARLVGGHGKPLLAVGGLVVRAASRLNIQVSTE